MATFASIDPELQYILLKGEPGTRKSTVALSYPGKQYWFSWDRKMQGLFLPAKLWGMDTSRIEYDDYDDWTAPRAKLELFRASCPYDVLVFDSVTSMADMSLRQVLKVKSGGKDIGGIKVNTIEDFNAESSAIQELIALTKDIQAYHATVRNKKIIIILIAHVISVEYKTTTGITHSSRTLVTAGKKVAAKIPAYCSEVYHFNVESVTPGQMKYTVLTEHVGDDFARTALGLPGKIEFNNKEFYKEFIAPAIAKLKA